MICPENTGNPAEGQLVNWLITGIRNEAGRIRKLNRTYKSYEQLILNRPVFCSTDDSHAEYLCFLQAPQNVQDEVEAQIMKDSMLSGLTSLQKEIVYATLIYGETEQSVATRKGVSQVAIHKTKQRGLKRIKQFLKSSSCHIPRGDYDAGKNQS